jgi:acyl transferase domain-containing protein/acyl-CoA synthetase (AMP-forming)/AMP-acid ligase II
MSDLFQNGQGVSTLVALLRLRAQQTPDARAYTFVKDGLREEATYSYAGLDEAARAVAVALALGPEPLQRGDRALLLYPPGLEFVAAFMGCLYAGVVPIPAPPPDSARFKRTFPRLRAIMKDAGARLIVSTASIAQNAQSVEAQDTRWICSDEVDVKLAAQWCDSGAACDDLAYLQYTSGSTSSPKGVMLSHRSVLRNLELSRVGWAYSGDSVAVTWMPYFHDYGLVDGLLQPLYSGIPCYVLSPLLFVKRPQRWLEVIQRYGATHTQAPNFAYELCLEKISPEQRDTLDLSSLRVASNGAEPVRAATYSRFVEYFGSCGFEPKAFCPSYGLAEATLLVSAKRAEDPFRVAHANAEILEREHRYERAAEGDATRSIVSCGAPLGDLRLLIVDPQTALRVPERGVGEIWVQDACVAQGYWGRPADSSASFDARVADDVALGGFLRTGDLGFVSDGELYVTGRLKDLIIVDGVNHYPQDIEWTVQQSHPDFRPEHCAAFSVEHSGEEQLVVVAEVNRAEGDWAAVMEGVRRAVAQTHEVELHALVLLRKGGIFKTSSGKIQRTQCRSAFLEGSLAQLAQWRKPVAAAPAASQHPIRAGLERWLIDALARQLEIPAQSIDPQAPFASYGLNSRGSVQLVGDLEQWLARDDLSPTLLWEHPSVRALCAHLEGADAAASEAPVGTPASAGSEVAIIGMACRLPGAASPQAFWNLLRAKGDAVRSLPEGRWQGSGMEVVEGTGLGCVRSLRAGFLDQVDRFDAEFFDITAREAEIMDPQQRLLLELSWEAIESARMSPHSTRGSQTGVFVGISTDDYTAWQFGSAERISAYTGTSKALSIAANRVSYQFDFLGPSMAIDTACSSSLVAVHQASAALQRGECSMALAAGVNLLLAPQMSVALSQAGMLAPDGRCKTFDARADGYGRGEGGVVLVLKMLDHALRDGDPIAAVIRGSAVNQDGRSNGLTAPNGLAQQRVIRQALATAGVAGHEINYVEAHGTGTPLGDPIEVRSLRAVLAQGRDPQRPCALGSVKANIGHLEAAAGAAGLLKTILSLQHGEILPHPTLDQINPLVELGDAFTVPTEPAAWPAGRRLAGVSAFGFGGTNAHVILESAPSVAPIAQPPVLAPRPHHLLSLSARDDAALSALAADWVLRLQRDDADWADLCFSAQTTRAKLASRLYIGAPDKALAVAALTDFLAGVPGDWQAARTERQPEPRVGFLFTGQGSQYVGMGRELYETQPGFRHDINACDLLLREHAGLNLIALLQAPPGPDSEANLARTDLCQPALFALQYALARLWMNWGVQPQALLGHSVGEFAAAVIAGVMSLADGVRLISARARLMHQSPGDGAMASVMADETQCRAALAGLEEHIALAVYNGPQHHVLSGERSLLDQVLARLNAAGVQTRALNVSHAFHSPLMSEAAQQLAEVSASMTFGKPKTPIFSNLSGTPIEPDAGYWPRHLREPVRFAQGLRAMRAAGVDCFIEIGPRATLLALARQVLDDTDLLMLPSLRPQVKDHRQMLESLAALDLRGQAVDWRAFDAPWPRQRLALPTYRFQGRRHWLAAVAAPRDAVALAFPGRRTASPLLSHTLFELRYDTFSLPWLAEHRVFDQVVVPGAAHVSLVLEAARSVLGESRCSLDDVLFSQALVVPEPGVRQVQLAVEREAGTGGRAFRLISQAEGEEAWLEHASGRLGEPLPSAPASPLESLRQRRTQSLSTDFYGTIWQPQIALGPGFRWVDEVWRLGTEVLARLRHPPVAPDGLRLTPGLIDSMLQVLVCAVQVADEALVPFGLGSFQWLAPVPDGPLWSHVRLHSVQPQANEVLSDVTLYADDGQVVARVLGFKARRVSSRELIRSRSQSLDKAVFALQWEQAPANILALQGRCLLLGSDAAELQALATALQAQSPGLTATEVPLSATVLDAPDATEVLLRAQGPFQRVIYLPAAQPEPQHAASQLLHLLQALLSMHEPNTPHELVLVTRQAQLQGGDASHAGLWGLARVLRLEHPELACRCVDIDSFDPASCARGVLTEGADLALRAGLTLHARVKRQPLPDGPRLAVRADGVYLISGGLGALGLLLADSLVRQGALHLLLLGRSAPSPQATQRLAAWRARGVAVHCAAVDIADPLALDAAIRLPGLPLRGVFHLAGELDDGMLRQLDSQRLGRVMRAKVGGAINLARATASLQLDCFVCYSSVAALTGSMGQGSYAAANAVVDALMAARKQAGLPGLSLQWGPWAEAGMAARQSPRDGQRWADFGITAIEPDAGMALFERLLSASAAPTLAVFPVNWATYLERLYGTHQPAMYQGLFAVQAPKPQAVSAVLTERIMAAPMPQRREMLEQALHQTVAAVLGLSPGSVIGARQRLFDMGLDSLGAVELRNRLAAQLGRDLRSTLLFDFPTLQALAEHIGTSVLTLAEPPAPAAPEATSGAAGQTDHLSDEELARLLAAELG